MTKLTSKSTGGTSFYDTTIKTTLAKLIKVLGEPQCFDNEGENKVNVDFDCETESGEVFTIYDWKYYRPIEMDETIEFHIGGHSVGVTIKAKSELLDLLNKQAFKIKNYIFKL